MRTRLITLALTLTAAPSPVVPAVPPQAPSAACPGVIIPMYGYIGPMWRHLAAAPPARTTTAIANLGNGPGAMRDPEVAALFDQARAAGVRVVGYVYTRYGQRPLALVTRDVARWERWYGVDGIFVDNVTSVRAGNFAYYRSLSHRIRASAGRYIVMNGWATQKYMALADMLLMFEGNVAGFRRFETPEWTRSFNASRFASIVYGVRGQKAMRAVLDASKDRNVGTLYVTDGRWPHQYRYLPSFLQSQDGYLQRQGRCGAAVNPRVPA